MSRTAALLAIVAAIVTALLAAGVVMAQGQAPPPYTGVKNPFPWNDTDAQKAGRPLYQTNCLCHGPDGASTQGVDFSAPDFPATLEKYQDFYFYVISEGEQAKGMPGFKSALSDAQRWQVLTYVWTLGSAAPTTPPTSAPPPSGATLHLTAPAAATAGQQVSFTASLQDRAGNPIRGAPVEFSLRVDFFVSGGLMALGQATTDDQGTAVFTSTPRVSGSVSAVAQYQDVQTESPLVLAAPPTPFYQATAEVQLPTIGHDVLIGPTQSKQLGPMGQAPVGGFRLPGSPLSWLWLLVATIALLWATYFRVMYNVYRMPGTARIGETSARLMPAIVLVIITVLGLVIIGMLFHGPYTHFQFPR